jgi:hypothetical protein
MLGCGDCTLSFAFAAKSGNNSVLRHCLAMPLLVCEILMPESVVGQRICSVGAETTNLTGGTSLGWLIVKSKYFR